MDVNISFYAPSDQLKDGSGLMSSVKSWVKSHLLLHRKGRLYQHTLCPKTETDGHDHIHVCFAARVLGKDIENHCPHYNRKGFILEHGVSYDCGGNTNECDDCKYFGSVTSKEDGLHFLMDSRVVDSYTRRDNEQQK